MYFKRKKDITAEFQMVGVRCTHCEAAIIIGL